jgi:biotin transport system ATP-binding protein
MISVEDLVCEFEDTVAIDGVSVTIENGSFVILTGPNGSGKTTLVRHFNGLLEPDSGSVTVDGHDVVAEPVAVRTSVGMVFQQPRDQFVASTVAADVAFGPENLGLDREEIDRRVSRALDAVNLGDKRDARIESLSGGEQARLAIAGALAMEPAYLVLDEPFASLDEPTRRSVLEWLCSLHERGTGIIVVTHDLRGVLEPAGRILGMTDGRLVVDAPTEDALQALEDLDVYLPPTSEW